jgi:ArsR family transcriptional regulator
VLHDAGLLDRDKRGFWVWYQARSGALDGLVALIGARTQ